MILIGFILLGLLVLKVYSSPHNHNAEQLGNLFIAITDNKGNLLTENDKEVTFNLDSNKNIIGSNLLVIGKDNNGNDITIMDVIPTLSVHYITEIIRYNSRKPNHNPSADEIRDTLKIEFKDLYDLSVRVFEGKILSNDDIINNEIENKKISEVKKAKKYIESKTTSNNELMSLIIDNIRKILNDNANDDVTFIRNYLNNDFDNDDNLLKKLEEILKVSDITNNDNSSNNKNDYDPNIYKVDKEYFEGIKSILVEYRNLKKLIKKLSNLTSESSKSDTSQDKIEKAYKVVYEDINKLLNNYDNNSKIGKNLRDYLSNNSKTFNYDDYFFKDDEYDLSNAKQKNRNNKNLLNLKETLLRYKINKQINLYKLIKGENDVIQSNINFNKDKLSNEEYNDMRATLTEIEGKFSSKANTGVTTDEISTNNIKDYYNIDDNDLIKKIDNKFKPNKIEIETLDKINKDIKEDVLKNKNIVAKVIESNSIFKEIYRKDSSGNINDQDYNDLVSGKYKVITDNRKIQNYNGYNPNVDKNDIKFTSFYNTIKYFIAQYKIHKSSFPSKVSNINNVNILLNNNIRYNSHDFTNIQTYLNGNEYRNAIDVHYINIMLKIAKEFDNNQSIKIEDFKSLDIVETDSGIYHIVGVNNNNQVCELFRFKNDPNTNDFVTINLGNLKYVDSNKVIEKSYNKNTSRSNLRVQPGLALLAKAGSSVVRTDNTNTVKIYEPKDYVVPATSTDADIKFYKYDRFNKKIIGDINICQDKVTSNIIGTQMIEHSEQDSINNYLAVISSYYDDTSFPSFGKYINNAYQKRKAKISNGNTNLDNVMINNAMELTRIEYIQPLNHKGEFEGYINEMNHSQEYKNMFQFNTNSFDKLSCTNTITPIRKRATDSCSIGRPSIVMNENANANIKDILSSLSKGSEEAKKLFSDYQEQFISSNINIEKLWNKLIEIYENNIDNIDINDKRNILLLLQNTINIYVNELSTNDIYTEERYISKNFIEKLKSKFNYHYSKYKKEKLTNKSNNNNNNEDDDDNYEIYKADYFENANSIYYKEELIDMINELYTITNYNNEDINIGLLIEINDEMYNKNSEDISKDIEELCNKIENLEINSNEKEKYKNKLLKIYKKLNEINNINAINKFLEGEDNNNSEIVDLLATTLADKLKEEFPDDHEIQSLYPIENYYISSSNNINLDHIKNLYGDNYIDFITTDTNSKYYIKYFMDYLKGKIFFKESESLDEKIFNDIKLLEARINSKIKQINQYESSDDHFDEMEHFTKLLSEYNELVSFAISDNKISISKDNSNTIQHIDLDKETLSKINYICTEILIKGINEIIKENPDKFNIEPGKNLENYISTRSDKSVKHVFGNKEIFEPTLEDLNKILKNPKTTKAEALSEILSYTSNGDESNSLSDLKSSYQIKYRLIQSQSPLSMNPNDIDEINAVTYYFDDINENWGDIENYQKYASRTFIKFLTTASKYDENIDIENIKYEDDGSIDISSVYKKGNIQTFSDLFSTMGKYIDNADKEKKISEKDKENINHAMERLRKHIEGCIYKLSQSSDRENPETFNNAIQYIDNIVDSAKPLINVSTRLYEESKIESSFSDSIHKIEQIKKTHEIYKNKNNLSNGYVEDLYSSIDMEEKILSVLKILKKYDPKTIIVNDNENSIKNPGNLCRNSKTLMSVLEKALQCYTNNIEEIKKSSSDSKECIDNLFYGINKIKYIYSLSNYIDHDSNMIINEDKIDEMEIIYSDFVRIHNENHDEKLIENIRDDPRSVDIQSIAEVGSRYVEDKLINIYNELFEFLNDGNYENENMGIIFEMKTDENNKVIKDLGDERSLELEYIEGELGQFKLDEDDKEETKKNLLKIYRNIQDIEGIFDKANKDKTKDFFNNSEAIYKLSNMVYDFLVSNYAEDKDIQGLRENYISSINGKDKKDIVSNNVLNIDSLVSKISRESILHNPELKFHVKNYFDYLKNELATGEGDNYESVIKEIKEVKTTINDYIKYINEYEGEPKDLYEDADHIIEVINNYNELIEYGISLGVEEIENFEVIDTNCGDKFSNRINYIRVKIYNEVLDDIARKNPRKFRLESGKKPSDYIKETNSGIKYSFDVGDTVYEPNYRDLNSIVKDAIDSKSDLTLTFVDASTNRYQILKLKHTLGMHYKLEINESSYYRERDDVNAINNVLKHDKLLSHFKNKFVKRIETFKQASVRMDKHLAKLSGLDENVENSSTEKIINEAKNVASRTNNKEQKDGILHGIKQILKFNSNQVVRLSGKVPNEIIDVIYKNSIFLNNVGKEAIHLIEINADDDFMTKQEKAMESSLKYNKKLKATDASSSRNNHNVNIHNTFPQEHNRILNKPIQYTPSINHGGSSNGSSGTPTHPPSSSTTHHPANPPPHNGGKHLIKKDYNNEHNKFIKSNNIMVI